MKQVILVRTDIKMGKGKTCAQVAHASLEAYKKALKERPEWVKTWESEGSKKVVLKVSGEQELLELYQRVSKEVPAALIRDAGLTQLPPGTLTAAGFGPAPEEVLDRHFSHLKLL
ncbi:MAG: peptidyl-tRNA hydrolase [Candidatus Diapherotrites archaeon]|nr:peptidyl-tRNA hydrolase [Candidatus Diapherotrites archaeon]